VALLRYVFVYRLVRLPRKPHEVKDGIVNSVLFAFSYPKIIIRNTLILLLVSYGSKVKRIFLSRREKVA
jgi:hypothetical protein